MTMHTIYLLSIPAILALAAYWQSSSLVSQRIAHRVISAVIALQCIPVIALTMVEKPTQTLLVATQNVNMIMLLLVLTIGFVVTQFATTYMQREPDSARFWQWLLLTLAAVIVVVISNHLVMLLLAWAAISLSLHKLLTFYPERPRAALAAHKKFILARSAELLLASAIALLYMQHHTFYLNELINHFNQVATSPDLSLTVTEQVAAVLIALVALIKCAQLPVHGWLMQVVEAPTPISALLHAGVINLGGFLLLVFAPLFMQAEIATWLVLLVAGFTTVIAALVMATRVSIKVRLAWSTSAQMGLMLIECALGLYELALMHLIAHSIYKAYAFLNSGNAVFDALKSELAPNKKPNLTQWIIASLIAVVLTGGAIWLTQSQAAWSMWLLLALAVTSLLAERFSQNSATKLWLLLPFAAIIFACYSVLKWLFSHAIELPVLLSQSAGSIADIFLCLLFLGLFGISLCLQYGSNKPWVKRLSISLFAGLYLDEWLTRLTLRVWPTRLPSGNPEATISHRSEQETKA